MNYSETVKKLLTLETDDPENEGLQIPDYKELGITAEHIDELMCMATDKALLDIDDPSFWGTVHAWYALGQLQHTAVIPQILRIVDDYDYDLLFDRDFPKVFRLMGKTAIEILQNYVNDSSNSEDSRCRAVENLSYLDDSYRNECILAINDCLEKIDETTPMLGGIAICALINLNAVESINVIKDAIDRGCVDIEIPGDIEDIEIDLGIRKERTTPHPNYAEEFVKKNPSLRGLYDLLNKDNKKIAMPITKKETPKIGRNDACPCGSGKKYKKCCLN